MQTETVLGIMEKQFTKKRGMNMNKKVIGVVRVIRPSCRLTFWESIMGLLGLLGSKGY